MKVLKNITKIAFSSLLILFLVSGCRESAGLETDPLLIDIPFTFTPAQGYSGNQVVIEGTGLSTVSMVSFGVVEAEVVSKTDTKITAIVPVGAITGKIKLVSDGLVTTSATDFVVDATPVPTIISFSPAIAGSGETVTITGNNLDKVDSVYIGSLKAELLSNKTASEINIVTPAGLQTGTIRMFYNYQTTYGMTKVAESVSSSKLSLKLPTIESATPDLSALNINDEITFIGTMFSSVTAVKFGTLAATFTVVSDSEMKVIVPANATTGKITMTVPDGLIEYATSFVVILPSIQSFFPTKGAEIAAPATRDITITGTKLDLVSSVKVGSTVVTVVAKTANNLTFTMSGTTSGAISLISSNGTVLSSVPFIITGDFWLSDGNDNIFSPVRCAIASNETSGVIDAIVAGGPTGAYHRLGGTTKTALTRTYITGKGSGEDLFLLYTPDANGVTFSFDMAYETLPANMINTDGSVTIQLFAFTSGDRSPYGFHKNFTVPFTGANNWQHVTFKLSDLIEAGSSGLIGGTVGKATANRCKPNKMRIMGLVFTTAPTAAGNTIVWYLDNIKFTIN